MLSEQRALTPSLKHLCTTHQPFQMQHSSLTLLSRVLGSGSGRGGTLSNNVRGAQEHLSSHGNTDATLKGKLTSTYLQNSAAVCIIPSLRKEMLDYPHRQQSGPCIPKAACRIQKISSSHSLALCLCHNPFYPSVFSTALLHGLI